MSIQLQLFPKGKMGQPRLGDPKWRDPERRQSIKDDSDVKMEWQITTPLWTMTCWVALPPASFCLTDTTEQIYALLLKRQFDIWDGENTTPGCSLDSSMYGRSITVVQPTIIFSSSSKICRRNARRIIQEEDIEVDPRGIGIEYYEKGPEFSAGFIDVETGDSPFRLSREKSSQEQSVNDMNHDTPGYSTNYPYQARSSNQTSKRDRPTINGALIHVGQSSCMMGGPLMINGEVFGLTAAHAFEVEKEIAVGNQKSIQSAQMPIHHRKSGPIGTLHWKRILPQASQRSSKDMDWALCKLDRNKIRLSNNLLLSNENILCPTNIAKGEPTNMAVIINTGTTGIFNGCIVANYLLVALPGSRCFQKMWIVILERNVRHIVAGKPGTTVAYIVLAQDIVKDISDQLGIQAAHIACKEELEVSEAVGEIKRTILFDESGTFRPNFSQDISAALTNDQSIRHAAAQDLLRNKHPLVDNGRPSSSMNRIQNFPGSGTTTLAAQSNLDSYSSRLQRVASTSNENLFSQRMIRDDVENRPARSTRLAALQNSDDGLHIFRSFSSVYGRILSNLEIEITKLEKITLELDEKDAQEGFVTGHQLRIPGYFERRDSEREDLNEKILAKLQIYWKYP